MTDMSAHHPWGRIYYWRDNLRCASDDDWTKAEIHVSASVQVFEFATAAELDNAVRMMNAAFIRGELNAKYEIRRVLGIDARS